LNSCMFALICPPPPPPPPLFSPPVQKPNPLEPRPKRGPPGGPPAARVVRGPWRPCFLGGFPGGGFLRRGGEKGGGGGGGGADEDKQRRVQAMGRSWKERPRLCGDPPLSLTAGPELGGARSSGRDFSAHRSWCGNLLFPFTKKMKRHVSGLKKLRCGGPGMPVPCGAEFVAPQTRRHKIKRVSVWIPGKNCKKTQCKVAEPPNGQPQSPPLG